MARRGQRSGFSIDDRFLGGAGSVAVKVTYYDGYPGSWRLVYRSDGQEQQSPPVHCSGKDRFRTATHFIQTAGDATGMAFDFEIRSEDEVPISFVRVVKR